MRPKSSRSLSFGIDAVDEFAVFIETVHFRPSQCIGNDGMVFAIVERPFFADVVATFEHFDVGVVTVVFVVGYQSVGLVVFDHNVVAVGETAQFFCRRVRKRRSNHRSQNRLRQTAALRRRRGRRFGRGRLKKRLSLLNNPIDS